LSGGLSAKLLDVHSRGRIETESKDQMRQRGLPSPDRADACAIAFAGRANAAPMNIGSYAAKASLET
jgi:hypothetical protein